MSAWIGALLFAAASAAGVLLAGPFGLSRRLDESPEPGRAPVLWLIAGSALLGAWVAVHGTTTLQIALLALVTLCLTAVWCVDVRYGIVPDVFSIGPLAVVLAAGAWNHQWYLFASAAVPAIPFAAAALFSRGRGMGWGDVKLAALGGAVLGAQTSILVFAVACVLAVFVAHLRAVRNVPIAFAPYLAAAIAAGIPLAGAL